MKYTYKYINKKGIEVNMTRIWATKEQHKEDLKKINKEWNKEKGIAITRKHFHKVS